MESITTINKRLFEYFGRTLDGRSNFRIVFSDTQTEIRVGEFDEYYGRIFLRTFKGAKETKKYPFIKEKYVLEKLIYLRNPEILSSENGSYEPVYVFQDKDGKPLPVIWRAVEYAVTTLLYGERTKYHKSDEYSEADEEVKRDTEYFENYLSDRPEFGILQQFGEAVSFAGIKRKED